MEFFMSRGLQISLNINCWGKYNSRGKLFPILPYLCGFQKASGWPLCEIECWSGWTFLGFEYSKTSLLFFCIVFKPLFSRFLILKKGNFISVCRQGRQEWQSRGRWPGRGARAESKSEYLSLSPPLCTAQLAAVPTCAACMLPLIYMYVYIYPTVADSQPNKIGELCAGAWWESKEEESKEQKGKRRKLLRFLLSGIVRHSRQMLDDGEACMCTDCSPPRSSTSHGSWTDQGCSVGRELLLTSFHLSPNKK